MGLFDRFKKGAVPTEEGLVANESTELVESKKGALEEVHVDIEKLHAIQLPIARLASLGGSVASMLPSLRTITGTLKYADNGLYRCLLPDGVSPRFMKDQRGYSLSVIPDDKGRFKYQARWVKAEPQTATMTTVSPINPATLMMAAALMSIDQKLDSVLETQKQIISFLEEEKEASIEGDLRTLTSILREYKFNRDSEAYTMTHHQIAADIKRTAESHMIFYQRQIEDVLGENKAVHFQQFVASKQADLQKKFRYYRLSLYLYAFASYLEIMLQGQYGEDYIEQMRHTILERVEEYTSSFDICYGALQKLSSASVERIVLKGAGIAGKSIGSFIGNAPILKSGVVDKWLVEKGTALEESSAHIGDETLKQFEEIRDPGCGAFTDNLSQLNRAFNHTRAIYFDRENLYLAEA